jgi:hypothetical protein
VPRHRQVRGRVPGRDVAEVDHGADLAVAHQDVQRVQVAVQPHRRSGEPRRRYRVREHAQRRGPVHPFPDRLQVLAENIFPFADPHAAERVHRRVIRGRHVQRAQEGAHRRRRRGPVQRRNAGGLTGQVWHERPRPGVPQGRRADPFGIRDWDWKFSREPGQPALLVADDLGTEGTARQPRDEPVTDPEQCVVPSVREERHGQRRQVRVLGDEQVTDEVGADLEVGCGHPVGHGFYCPERIKPFMVVPWRLSL